MLDTANSRPPHGEADFVVSDAEPRLPARFQKGRALLGGIDQEQAGFFGRSPLGVRALVAVIEDRDILPSLEQRAQIHVNGTHAAQGRGGQTTNLGAAFEIDEETSFPAV